MMQEGRGIGLLNKIAAYKLQEQGLIPLKRTFIWDLKPMNAIMG
jgi:GTP cyclohydrolase II